MKSVKSRRAALVSALLVMVGSIACGGESPESASFHVSALSTDTSHLDGPGGVMLDVPPGAVKHDVTIVVTTAPKSHRTPPATALVATPLVITPEGETFNKALALTIPIEPSRLPNGKTIDDVVVYTAPHGTDAFVPLPTHRMGNAVVAAPTHFSDFVAVVPMTTCPAPTGAPTTHSGWITASETWGAGIHEVTSDLTVRTGAKLTIEPCADVRVAPGRWLYVDRDSLGLVARGTASQPITFGRQDPTQAWSSLYAYAPAPVDLAYVTIEGGNDSSFYGSTLVVRNTTGVPSSTLKVDHVTVKNAAGVGISMMSAGFDPLSTALTVTGSGTHPVFLNVQDVTNLPPGNYTGNGVDAFLLQSDGNGGNTDPITRDTTMRDLGIPYQVGTSNDTFVGIDVGDSYGTGQSVKLTIEPGVTIKFAGTPGNLIPLRINARYVSPDYLPYGILVANGTPAKPIVFTSAQVNPQPGDWTGLYFENVIDPSTSVTNAVIEYAGGYSSSIGLCKAINTATNGGADCAVILWLDAPPATQFITNTTFARSKFCGVYRGWRGTAVDFAPTNTFTANLGCNQSNVPTTGGSCPSPDTCM